MQKIWKRCYGEEPVGFTPRLEGKIQSAVNNLPLPQTVAYQEKTKVGFWRREVLVARTSTPKEWQVMEVIYDRGAKLVVVKVEARYENDSTPSTQNELCLEGEITPVSWLQARALGAQVPYIQRYVNGGPDSYGHNESTGIPLQQWWGTVEDQEELVRGFPHLCGK